MWSITTSLHAVPLGATPCRFDEIGSRSLLSGLHHVAPGGTLHRLEESVGCAGTSVSGSAACRRWQPFGAPPGRPHVSIVDVEGTTVTLVYQGSTGGSPSDIVDGYGTLMDDGLAIIDSIVWETIG